MTGAAYLGELVIRAYKGKWFWKDDYFHVVDINDNKRYDDKIWNYKTQWNPLSAMLSYWRKPVLYRHTMTWKYNALVNQLGLDDYDTP